MNDNLLSVKGVAEYLGVPVGTVYAWATRGIGPKRYKIGKHSRYRQSDVDAWVDAQTAASYGRSA